MLSPLFCCLCCSGSRTAFKRVVFVAAFVVKGGGVSFLEAKTVNTFIGLVVDVALPLRGDGNDFEDDDAVTRALLERDAIVVIARPPLPLNEPTEVKVVEDDPERSGDIIFFYTSFLSLVWISSSVTQKKEKSVNLSLSLSLSCNSHKTHDNTPSLSLCVCVCVCPRARIPL